MIPEIDKQGTSTDLPLDYTMSRAEEQAALTAIFERIEDQEYEEQHIEDMFEMYGTEEDDDDFPF